MEQPFAVNSTTKVEFKSFKKQSSCRATRLSDRYSNGMGMTVTFQCMTQYGIYCYHVTTFWNLIGTANSLAAEVTVWTHKGYQTVSPMAWEWG